MRHLKSLNIWGPNTQAALYRAAFLWYTIQYMDHDIHTLREKYDRILLENETLRELNDALREYNAMLKEFHEAIIVEKKALRNYAR